MGIPPYTGGKGGDGNPYVGEEGVFKVASLDLRVRVYQSFKQVSEYQGDPLITFFTKLGYFEFGGGGYSRFPRVITGYFYLHQYKL